MIESFQRNRISIKLREQVRLEVLSRSDRSATAEKQHAYNLPSNCGDVISARRHAHRRQLLTSLLTSQHNMCNYCGEKLKAEDAHFDMLLPLPWEHGAECTASNQIAFRDLGVAAGMACACCATCDAIKSGNEKSGIGHFTQLITTKADFLPMPKKVDFCAAGPKPRLIEEVEGKPGIKNNLSNARISLAVKMAPLFGLRIYKTCRCIATSWNVSYQPRIQSLEVGCYKCIPSNRVHGHIIPKGASKKPTSKARLQTPDSPIIAHVPDNPAHGEEPKESK
jgi:hypothetical protein